MNHTITAFHIGRRINLQRALSKLHFEIVKDEHSFLLLKKSESAYVYLKEYGSISFCNFHEDEMIEVLRLFNSSNFDYNSLVSEEYEIEINENAHQHVNFNTVVVPEFSIDVLHIVMFNLCQSVAMENYQAQTNQLLEETRKTSDNLRNTGDIGLQRRKLRQFIGKTMVLKTRIAENLLVFETSDLAWSNEQLSNLDVELRNQLDIVNRHHGLQYSLNIVKENLDLFRDILQHKHSSMLEWIIIILILLEVFDLIIHKLI